MKIYFTNGTEKVLKKVMEIHENEILVLMENMDTCLLIHETEGTSIFKEPRKYEVIGALGPIKIISGFAVFEYIPVTDEGKTLFEYHYKNQINIFENQLGFLAIRILRPFKQSEHYIIFTLWKDETYYKRWKGSELYKNANLKYVSKKGVKKETKILLSPSFIRTYSIFEDKNH